MNQITDIGLLLQFCFGNPINKEESLSLDTK